MPTRAVVTIQRADSYQTQVVQSAIESAIAAFGGWSALVKRGDRVLVKPNCICGSPPEQAAQTHPAIIVEVCRQLIDAGAKPFVGDSPAWGSLRGNLQALGVLDELARLDVPIVAFDHPVRTVNPRGKVFHKLSVDAAALEADAIVNLPKLKAHKQLLLTAAIKNMFGCVSGRRKAWWHVKAGSYDNYFGRMLVETFDLLRPAVTILDAVLAMQGNGPARGEPRQLGMVLASTDGPALECVAADIVGIPPEQLRTVKAARELEVGTPYLEQIEVRGASLAEVRVTDFVLPRMMPIGFSIPRFVKGAFKDAWITHQQTSKCSSC